MGKEKKEPEEITGDDLKPMALLKRIKEQGKKIEELKGERNESKVKGKDKRKRPPKRDASGKWVKGAPEGEPSPPPQAEIESGPDTRDDYEKFYDGDF